MQVTTAQNIYLQRATEEAIIALKNHYIRLIVQADSVSRVGYLTNTVPTPVPELTATVLDLLRQDGFTIAVTESGGNTTYEIIWGGKLPISVSTSSAGFTVASPLLQNDYSTNLDTVRQNLQRLYWDVIFSGKAQGFVSGFTYNGSGQLDVATYSERTGHAAADKPSRDSTKRIFARQNFTYTAGSLTKIRKEVSLNSGTTWLDFDDLEGNSFNTFGYVSGRLDNSNWSNT